MNSILGHIKLLRPLNVFIAGLAMVLASAILDVLTEIETVFRVVMVVLCYTGAANALNDVVDYKIDLINCPMRPIPSGYVSKKSALFISIILFSAGSWLCLALSQDAKVIGIVIAMPLIVLYSKIFKGVPLIGNITVSFILGLSFLFCGAAFNQMELMLIPTVLAFGLTLVRELVKDIADMSGDKSAGLNTFPITVGIDKTIQLTIFLIVCVGLGAFILFITGYYSYLYGIILILGVEIPLGVVVVSLVNNPGVKAAKQSARLLKFSTIAGLIAIYIGTL